MSSEAQPITGARFAAALQELPLENLHLTAAEIRNSLGHLESSNAQMAPFAAAGDAVCAEAVAENRAVIARMHARIELLRAEVERRGMPWPEELDVGRGEGASRGGATEGPPPAASNGSLSDEELRRRMEERMREMQDDDEEGVHL